MKILFDHQIFELQKFGGISRYFYELIEGIEKSDLVEWDFSTIYSDNEYLKNGSSSVRQSIVPIPLDSSFNDFLYGTQFRGKARLFQLKNKLLGPPKRIEFAQLNKEQSIKKLKESNFDVFHPTYYDDYFLEHLGGKPFVITVYDLIHQIYPEFFLKDTLPDKNANLLRRASVIIAISESTKRDLIDLFGIEEQRIKVTYLANSLPIIDKLDINFASRLPKNYLLFTGHRVDYKNFLFFAQAFRTLTEKDRDLNVVCTGPAFNNDELRFLKQLKIDDKFFHLYVSDVQLSYLYKNAVAFIFPSLYEGFGLPVLEAFSCGCPVLCSRSSSLVEIAGDSAIYFDPKSAGSILSAIQLVQIEHGLRKQLIEKGYQRLKQFSWQKTVNETLNVYDQVIQASPLR